MKKIIAVTMYLAPALVFAQQQTLPTGGANLTNIEGLILSVGRLVNLLIPLVIGIAMLLFFWGLARFIMSAGDEGAREQGRNLMIWGIIAFVVMLSLWAIVNFIQSALGINGAGVTIAIPQV
jgi:hypothetical protein